MCDHLSPTHGSLAFWHIASLMHGDKYRTDGEGVQVATHMSTFSDFFTTSDPRLQRCCSSCASSGHAFDGPWPSLRKKRVCCALLWWNMVESFPTILSFGTGVFSLLLPSSVCVCVCSVVASMCIRCMLSACCLCLRTWGTVLVSEWLVTIVRNVCHTQTAEPATWSHESHPARPHRRRSERILNTCVFRLWITCLKPKLKGCVPMSLWANWFGIQHWETLSFVVTLKPPNPLLDLSWPTSTNVPMRKIDWLWSASGCLAKCISVRDVDGHQSFVPRMPYGNIWEWHWHHCSLYYCTCCNDSSHLITSWKVVDREYTWI